MANNVASGSGPQDHPLRLMDETIYKQFTQLQQHDDTYLVDMDENARQFFGMDYPLSPYVARRLQSIDQGAAVNANNNEFLAWYPGAEFCNKYKDKPEIVQELSHKRLRVKVDATNMSETANDAGNNKCITAYLDLSIGRTPGTLYRIIPRNRPVPMQTE